jgi:hypothetical protein
MGDRDRGEGLSSDKGSQHKESPPPPLTGDSVWGGWLIKADFYTVVNTQTEQHLPTRSVTFPP